MTSPLVEGLERIHFGTLTIDEALSGEYNDAVAIVNARWLQAAASQPTPVTPPKRKGRRFQLLKKPTATMYQVGPLLVALTTTAALAGSRPSVGSALAIPVNVPARTAALVLNDSPEGVLLRGSGRDLHGVIPDGAVSTVSGPRGNTVDDWDF
jgi:hypothetical protein